MRAAVLAQVKDVIKKYYLSANHGLFFTRNIVNDWMTTVYQDDADDIQIDVCYNWSYFEVFGLTHDEQEVIASYYQRLRRKR